MRWFVNVGDLLDVSADVLVCSANGWLNLSGGVGAALAARYGWEMQDWLHAQLRERGAKCLPRGSVVVAPPCGSPYRAVIHAVGIDPFYDTDAAAVAATLRASLAEAARLDARSVAAAAIGTGYGRLPIAEFAVAAREVIVEEFAPIERVVIGLRSSEEADELRRLAPGIEPA